MDEITLRDYQSKGVDDVARLSSKGVRRIIFQLATGGGKTVVFSALAQRFISRIDKKVFICVHRHELLEQTVNALKKVAGINAGLLIAEYKTICQKVGDLYIPFNNAQVVVCMIETLNNRIKKYSSLTDGVGMLIVDEVHLGNFVKIYSYFETQLIVGFSATPISANKKEPLKNHFDTIISPVNILELIKGGFLSKNISIAVKNGVNKKKLKIRGGEYDEKVMASLYSQSKNIKNCVIAYEEYCIGEKTIVFNCNIDHSKLVTDRFVQAGYNARHIDGTFSKEEREQTMQWFKNTPDAIINSVALLTTGVDEPSILNCIVNRSTLSLPLWLQMTGRAARVTKEGIRQFKIIDLGSNIQTHLDWSYPHDWNTYFFYPERARNGGGPAPTKMCVECESLIHLSTKICPFCLANNERQQVYDKNIIEMEVITQGIDIDKLISKNKEYMPYRTLHVTKGILISKFRKHYTGRQMTDEIKNLLNGRYQELVKQWCEKEAKPYNLFIKNLTKKWLFDEINRLWKTNN